MIYPIKFIFNKIKTILYPFKIKVEKEREKIKRRYKFFKFKSKKVFKNKKMLYNSKKQKNKLNKQRNLALRKKNRHYDGINNKDSPGEKGAKTIERKSKNNRAKKKN